ncbi:MULTISPECIES: twin-arginine translocase TatA/TatE family subunit [Pseudomonas]|uniref:Sec-independent protein translocase protein TatA n=3 Tax=Pseudomonas TaxID=286 RepID=A0ABX6H750_9PSED|nr:MULTISPECIES: twin-arginine translocase TatA/TatE family subunit [Pseudomonas]MBC3956656.1 twin-arginine translocase TatA/TatE family subunit [Pseudomonas triticifolii]QHF01346.1 twin-arginine translocase TatA/TatE family subunit [Pseudomonas asturiensis]
MGIFDWKHWIVILIVVVLVFGTKKLKGLGTDVGESIKGFRKAMNDDEKPADQASPQPQPQPQQPYTAPQGSPLNQPHTIDAHAHKVEEPTRKDQV